MSLDIQFIELCKSGNLEEATKLYNTEKIDIHAENDVAFRWSCCNGHLEVVKQFKKINFFEF